MPGGSSGGGSSGGSAVGMSIPGLEIPGIGGAGGGAGGDGDGEAGNADGNCGGGFGLPGGMGQSGDCEGGAGEGSGAGGVGEYPGESDAQRAERLGGELDESVGDFDEVLMEEQREISTVSRNTQGFGGGASDGGSSGSVGLGGQQGAGGSSAGGGNAVSILNPTEERTASIDSMSEGEKHARLPDDIVENVGDDIVARQLYEAALAEDDPVLRERLWEEYRKYNNL